MLTRLSGAPPGAGWLCCCRGEWWSGRYQQTLRGQTSHPHVTVRFWLRLKSSWAHWENLVEDPLTAATLSWGLKLYYFFYSRTNSTSLGKNLKLQMTCKANRQPVEGLLWVQVWGRAAASGHAVESERV